MPIVACLTERRVAEAHQRVGADLVHTHRETRSDVGQERARVLGRFLRGHVDDEVNIDAFEGVQRVVDRSEGLCGVVRTVQVPQDRVVEGLRPDADGREADLLEHSEPFHGPV